MGPSILPNVEHALKHPDPEVAWRAEMIKRELRRCTQWTGTEDDDWHNPANWSPPYVPDESCDVTIVFDKRIEDWPRLHKTGATVRSIFVGENTSLCLLNGCTLLCRERLIVHGMIEANDGSVLGPAQKWAYTVLHGPIWSDKKMQHGLPFPFGTAAYAVIIVRTEEESR